MYEKEIHFGNWPRWPWPLTQWPQGGCVDQVWRRYVNAFSSYWSETVLALLTLVTLTF